MLNLYTDISKLEEDSLLITNESIITAHCKDNDDLLKYTPPMDLSWIESLDGYYSIHKNTIAYIHDGRLFVTPYTVQALEILQDTGFIISSFYVPFSDGTQPYNHNEKQQWQDLLFRATLNQKALLDSECSQWCLRHGISNLDQSFLDDCIKLPIDGTYVHHVDYDYTDYLLPIIKVNDLFGPTIVRKLGRYYNNDEIVAFHYLDNFTYITYGNKSIDVLESAGYQKGNFEFPLYAGDFFLIEPYKSKWNEIISK